jgi:hypothetical protein
MRQRIHIYINYAIYRKFSSLCRFLGLKVGDVLEKYMKDFIEKHKDQAPLDFYLQEAKEIKILNITQNNYNYLILASIAKLDPQKWLDDLSDLDPNTMTPKETEFWKNKLPELILEANRVLEEIKLTGQGEEYAETIQDLIAKASELLQKILAKKSRRELIHA